MKPYTFNFLDHGSGHLTVQQIKSELERRGLEVVILSEDSCCEQNNVHELIKRISVLPFQAGEENPRYHICLLYKDSGNRLFNVTLTGASGLTMDWEEKDAIYGGLQAVVAMVLLSRVLSYSADNYGVFPAWISLMLGIVLKEEVALSHLSVALNVYGLPSVSAFDFEALITLDWPMHLMVAILGIAATAAAIPFAIPNLQKLLTLGGMAWAIAVLAANLGSRAWRNLNLTPLPWTRSWYSSVKFIGVYLMAALVGITVPFLGGKKVQLGGVVAIRTVILKSFVTLIVLVLSDLDALVAYLIPVDKVQSNHQTAVTVIMTSWWTLATIISLWFCKRIPVKEFKPEPGALLVATNASPVGYYVPNLPSHPVKTGEHQQASSMAHWIVVVVAIMTAILPGIAITAIGVFLRDSTQSSNE